MIIILKIKSILKIHMASLQKFQKGRELYEIFFEMFMNNYELDIQDILFLRFT